MSIVTVCKNVIASNNKRKWVDPTPPIRIANSSGGKAMDHAFTVIIKDKDGRSVAKIKTTKDGKAIVKCGAKVAINTRYPVEVVR